MPCMPLRARWIWTMTTTRIGAYGRVLIVERSYMDD
jgi:hypothetical protein